MSTLKFGTEEQGSSGSSDKPKIYLTANNVDHESKRY